MVDPRDGTRKALKKMPNVFQNLISSRRVYRELRMLCHFKHENVSLKAQIYQINAVEGRGGPTQSLGTSILHNDHSSQTLLAHCPEILYNLR